jgi:hypothetical protein|tara:strand:- start:2496 stop:3047 length:552 start_codon:yes stop_codon:yes gene_type:complete
MENSSPIKEILYKEIKKIPKKEIQKLQNEDYFRLITSLFDNTKSKLSSIRGKTNEKLGILSESLSHYVFTEMLIPSQRKIVYKDIEIDIIIPDLNVLKNTPNNAIIIYFAKSNDINKIQKKIEELQSIQKNTRNIWIVLHEKLSLPCKIYIINHNENSFSDLFRDAKHFVINKNLNKLRILKT